MRLAMVLTPPSDEHLRLARQVGVTDIVLRYPGRPAALLRTRQAHVERFGLKASVVEGFLPIEHIKLGDELREAECAELLDLIRAMGDLGIPILCYNFMPGSDWTRTSYKEPERGGAWVSGFDLSQVPDQTPTRILGPDHLWDNLKWFLERALPVAESAGVTLAMHPDDPPIPVLHGHARIMNSVMAMEQLMAVAPSKANKLCFCQGTLASLGVDIPVSIRRLGSHIAYVHFRDARGRADHFVETFHDNGPTNMYASMLAYRDIGYRGPMRPDHVPQLVGEEDGDPGYTMSGRLFAAGYMLGLMQAVHQGAKVW